MKRFGKAPSVGFSTPKSVSRNGYALQDWIRLARRSPGAVPAHIRQVIERRYPEIAQEVGYA